jgi:hypothetical protein
MLREFWSAGSDANIVGDVDDWGSIRIRHITGLEKRVLPHVDLTVRQLPRVVIDLAREKPAARSIEAIILDEKSR